MKLETQRDRWQAVLDGYEIENGKGVRFKMGETGLLYLSPEHSEWFVSASSLYAHKNEGLTWGLYEPPKPENKVIVIADNELADGINNEKYYKIDALSVTYDTENDAIRAAMEWIGGKAGVIEIQRPNSFQILKESAFTNFDVGRLQVLEALLMRWPIEIRDEV